MSCRNFLLLVGLALSPALLFSQITAIQPTDPIQGSHIILNGNFTNLQNAVNARPAAAGARTTNAITVYDADGNLLASGCRIVSGSLECGTGADSAGVELPELAANGTNSFSIYGKDNQAASVCIVMPDARPTSGQALKFSGSTTTTTDGKVCDVMEWGTAGSGGSDRVSVPASATSTCTTGQWAANTDYFFYCPATNTWVRSALATWETVATPTFSPSSPYTGEATTVTVSTATSGATIKYCTDTDNTCSPASGTDYSAPVSITTTGYLRAIATKTGVDDSAVASWSGTIGAGGGPITDDFAGSGALSNSWADTWLTVAGHVTCARVSGEVVMTADYKSCSARNTDAALNNDGWVQVDVKIQNGSLTGPIWRASDNNLYALKLQGSYFEVRKIVDGVDSYAGDFSHGMTISDNSWYTIKVAYSGSTFQFYIADQGSTPTLRGSVTDSSLSTGKPGILVQSGGTPYPVVDNWSAQ